MIYCPLFIFSALLGGEQYSFLIHINIKTVVIIMICFEVDIIYGKRYHGAVIFAVGDSTFL